MLCDLQFCCHRCSTWDPYSLAQAVQGSPHCGWRNPVSAQLMALSPCQLDDESVTAKKKTKTNKMVQSAMIVCRVQCNKSLANIMKLI